MPAPANDKDIFQAGYKAVKQAYFNGKSIKAIQTQVEMHGGKDLVFNKGKLKFCEEILNDCTRS